MSGCRICTGSDQSVNLRSRVRSRFRRPGDSSETDAPADLHARCSAGRSELKALIGSFIYKGGNGVAGSEDPALGRPRDALEIYDGLAILSRPPM